jgi:hypothetical protein
VSFVGTAKEIDKVKDWAREVIKNIVAEDFKATPGQVCSTCDYRQICPFARLNK